MKNELTGLEKPAPWRSLVRMHRNISGDLEFVGCHYVRGIDNWRGGGGAQVEVETVACASTHGQQPWRLLKGY
jgi:hypothetical protein